MGNKLKLAVVGTGVVGNTTLRTWVRRSYDVTGYDVSVETIQKLRAEGFIIDFMHNFYMCDADLVFVCISTPQSEDGTIFLDFMMSGLEVIGQWITSRVQIGHYPMIVMKSTMLPNLSKTRIIPALEKASGVHAGIDFGYAHVPEVLRETDALTDEETLWQIVIGEYDVRTASTLEELFAQFLGAEKDALLTRVPLAVAEAAKIISNVFNATRISFVNMIAQFLDAIDIDGQMAIDVAARMGEGFLNSWYGTRAHIAYDGKCLPKDVAALLAMARETGIPLPQLQATRDINQQMYELAAQGLTAKPVIVGHRRANAAFMRQHAIEAYVRYQNLHADMQQAVIDPGSSDNSHHSSLSNPIES